MKNLGIMLLLIGAILSGDLQAQDSTKFSLEDIWRSGDLYPNGVRGFRSMKDGKHYTKVRRNDDKTKDIVKYAYSSGKEVGVLMHGMSVQLVKSEPLEWSQYALSDDESKVILSADVEPIYRYSSKANFYIYDLASKTVKSVDEEGKQMYATLSANNTHVAYVRDNNLYVKDLQTGKIKAVTNDGKKNHIINGANDWVYEEEFAFDQSYQWSPDGSKIAYYRFDESRVKEFNMAMYGDLYPDQYKFKYPKAGEENSIVEIYIYDLNTGVTTRASTGAETDIYYPRIKWTQDPNTLCVYRMNRLQNNLELLLCDAKTGTCKVMFSEESKTFIEITDDLTFLKNGNEFIWTSRKDGYNHIYLYGMDGKLVKQVTSGEWDVLHYYGYNEKAKTFYYHSAETSPLQSEVYSITRSGDKKCISESKGNNRGTFSATMDYFMNSVSSSKHPPIYTMRNAKGKVLYTLEDNAELAALAKQKNVIHKEFFSFKTSEDVELNGWMIKPNDFDASKKYPVLMYVYGGPGSQTVKDSWYGANDYWYNLLADNGYIVVSVDNRGTGSRGSEFFDCTYQQLGKYETIDQIEAAKYLGKQSYVDDARIGIWGWSYGGYMTLSCLTKGEGLFKAGIAVAPVTNWRYYDTIYTERYMRTPQENAAGYDDNSPINFVEDFQGNLLLVHGTADDNVHYQNSLEFVNAMVNANKQFEMFMYPDKNHGIYGGNTRYHLYTKMTDFILNNL